ncbi:MAG: flagellar biosynthetic protein FliO [Gammaproteobacteria bacterium]|nr:flagellar biosynthetic protein FliO [Gammaproteobacteria bacterium]MDH5594181.1 flagellar biosynthetic protein FliO [Gammaproteobacteria bacterium]MDH5614587.1 flagellar biosynthetic protein FliO [Gammaproteobacteria bacterium]
MMSRMFPCFLALFGVAFSPLLIAEEKVRSAVSPGPISMDMLIQLVIGLLIVLAVIVAAAWFMRRFGKLNFNAGRNIKILEGLAIGQRERVVLMQVGEKQLLVGVTQGRMETLLVLDEKIKIDERPTQISFAERLTQALKQKAVTS